MCERPGIQSLLSDLRLQGDACSTNSDGSLEQQGSRHGRPRRIQSNVGVDAAKQAAMSALAGLDMTTTKANLDASKAAAATARANGEVPTQTRKSSLRSVSCRQLGSSSTSSVSGGSITTNKSVAFDDSANATLKNRAAADARPAQWRGGLAEGQQPRTTRYCYDVWVVLGRQGCRTGRQDAVDTCRRCC